MVVMFLRLVMLFCKCLFFIFIFLVLDCIFQGRHWLFVASISGNTQICNFASWLANEGIGQENYIKKMSDSIRIF